MKGKGLHMAFILTAIVLIMPLLMQPLPFIKFDELKGYFIKPEPVQLTCNNWKNEEFQKAAEEVLKYKLRCRPILVKIYNQYRYWMFREFSAASVVKGKNGYFFETHYISSYLGENYIGKNLIASKLENLQKVTDTLASKGVSFLLVIAPGKASALKEYLPEQYDQSVPGPTNYKDFTQILSELRIHYIDFHDFFINAMDTAHYPLYPKGGTHWSMYGSYIAFDSIHRYMEYLLKRELNSYEYFHYEKSKKPRVSDRDIEAATNLLFYQNTEELIYPFLRVTETHFMPCLLTIADSYYWTMVNSGLPKLFFRDFNFWYYFKENHSNKADEPAMVSDYTDLKKEIEKRDIILFMITEGNLYDFSWDFVEKMTEIYNIR